MTGADDDNDDGGDDSYFRQGTRAASSELKGRSITGPGSCPGRSAPLPSNLPLPFKR